VIRAADTGGDDVEDDSTGEDDDGGEPSVYICQKAPEHVGLNLPVSKKPVPVRGLRVW
jgi:hypothetical protein